MIQGDVFGIGVLLVALGVVFWLATRFLLRAVPKMQKTGQGQQVVELPQGQENNPHAIMLVQPGGRVADVNPAAKRLFNLEGDEIPDLELIARRIRPGEKFLELCAKEGRSRLVVNGQAVDCVSYHLVQAGQPITMVTFQTLNSDPEGEFGRQTMAQQNLQWLTEFTQVVGSSLDLTLTLQSLQENLRNVLPADLIEICLWDAENEHLTPYRFIGGISQAANNDGSLPVYLPGESFAGLIINDRRPQLIEDLSRRPDLRIPGGRGAEALQSLIGVPLVAQNELVGTLAAGSLTPEAFSNTDLNLLKLLSGPAASALSNARRFQNEQLRSAELAGLAQLAQGFSSARDPQGLFSRLVESILPLVRVDILGFLIYNEMTRTLEGQEPIHGFPAQFVELYRVPVPSNSPAEQMLLDQDLIITENAADAPEWDNLGLGYLARAASLRDTVLVPLVSGGRMLGFLQASNHSDGTSGFSQEEIHLLTIVANQAAPVIENITLVLQARQRVLRAESLRRIASLASSAATLDEILTFVLQELSRLVHADLAFVFLLGEGQSVLRMHQVSLYGRPQALPGLSYSLPTDDPQYHFTVTGSLHALSTRNINDEKTVIPFYQQLTQAWQVVSVVAVPLVVRDVGIGELWLCSRRDGAFDQGDLQAVATAGGQLAGVVEQSYLSAQTDERLRRRVDQLTSLTRISRELSTSRDLPSLLRMVYDESLKISGAACGIILLIDFETTESEQPVIRYHTGDEPPEHLSPEAIHVLHSGEMLDLSNLEQAKVAPPHEGVTAMLMVAIRYQTRSVGLIILHGNKPGSFEPDEAEIIQTLAAQAAIALGDAYLFEELQMQENLLQCKAKLIENLNRLTQLQRNNRSLPEILEEITAAIRAVTPFQVVVISLYDETQSALIRTVSAGLGVDAWDELRSYKQPWRSVQTILRPEFKVGTVFFIPTDQSPVIPSDVHTITVLPTSLDETTRPQNDWSPDDLLLVPLLSEQGEPLGLISLDAPVNGMRPDRTTYEALDQFGAQASLAIESWQHILNRDERLMQLEAVQNRLQQAADQARTQIPLFLRHDLEQTVAIDALNRQMERVRAGLDIAEQANRQPDSLAVMRSLARELMVRFDMQLALVAESQYGNMRLLDVVGSSPAHANPEVLFGQRNPLRQILQDGGLLMVADLESDPDWRNSALFSSLGARAFVCLPVEISETRRGGVLVMGQHPLPVFDEEDIQIYTQLSRQVSLGTQNLVLLSETRRRLREMDLLLEFTRNLGMLDPRGILLVLIETVLKVLPNADAGWVALLIDNHVLLPQVARGYSDNEALLSINFQHVGSGEEDLLPMRVLERGRPVRTDVVFAKDYSLISEDLLRYKKATGGRLPVSSMVVPINRGNQQLGVLVIDHFSLSEAFEEEDEALVVSLTQQSALALENSRLFVSAEQRASQLQALNQISAAISSSLQHGELISTLLPQLRLVLPYDTATLWLKQGNILSVAAANGFKDNESRVGISVAVDDSALFQEMVQTTQPVSVPDVRRDPRFPSLLQPEYFSWLGIPLISTTGLIGAIALEKHEPGFYTSEHLQSASTFVGQAGVAFENARLFEQSTQRAIELDQRSRRLLLLNQLSTQLSASLNEDEILRLTCQQLHKALNVTWVSAVIVEPTGAPQLRLEFPSEPQSARMALPETPLLEHLKETRGVFSSANVATEVELQPLCKQLFNPRDVKSVAFIPLVTAVDLRGWLVIQTSVPTRFSSPEIELARTISNQAAVALENARLYNETRRLTEDLEQRVEERTREVRREHNNTQALLKIITELSSSLDLTLVMDHTLAVLNESIGAEQSLVLLSDGKTYQAGLDLTPVGGENASIQAGVVGKMTQWINRQRLAVLADDIHQDARWDLSSKDRPAFRSVIAVPLILGEEVLGALLLLHRQSGAFLPEQVSLVEATARQFSIALNNAELFILIRDQAEHLGGLLREQQIESSRSRAILESVADGVLVTDAAMSITLLNASAARILGLKPAEVVNQSLDAFTGMFGGPGRSWRETIQRWSQDPQAYQRGETFAGQIDLENGRVVAVNLAPVFFREQFLATVSIFRDITQEVQVDRLKSEFVANVSHELRTPMTSIIGYVEIMLVGAAGEITAQQQRFLEIVKSNTERLNGLVDDLLDVSRIEAGRMELSMQPLDLCEMAELVVENFRQRSLQEKKEIRFGVEAPADLPMVMGDGDRIRQVLTNLVSNGYNYTPENGQVVVRLIALPGEVQVDICDNGIGVAPRDQRRIFERFYRGEDPLVLSTAGTGLGLAMAKILVEMHHGRIWFQSSGVRGEGSTFSFALPLPKDED